MGKTKYDSLGTWQRIRGTSWKPSVTGCLRHEGGVRSLALDYGHLAPRLASSVKMIGLRLRFFPSLNSGPSKVKLR